MTTVNDHLIPITAPDGEPSICRSLALSRATVSMLINTGQLKTVTVGRRRFTTPRFLAEYIDALEQAS